MKRKLPSLDKRYSRYRPLSPEEAELWRAAMGVDEKKKLVSPSPGAKEGRGGGEAVGLPPSLILPRKGGGKNVDSHLDKTTLAKIRRGSAAIEATLDLHGYTRETAYGALIQFIVWAQAQGLRLVLVITGKGRGPEAGTLRELLPRWLCESPLRERIIAYDSASPRHGGSGAWYVRIRKSQ